MINARYLGRLVFHLRSGTRFAHMSGPLARFGRNQFEKLAAEYWDRVDLKPLSACQDAQATEFLFQCVYLPLFAALQIELITRTIPGDTKFWLYQPATYLIAWERMHLEMVLSLTRKARNSYRGVPWEKPVDLRSFDALPKPTMKWFLEPPSERSHWLRRLDQWREAAEKSFFNSLASVNPDVVDLGEERLVGLRVAGGLAIHFSSCRPAALPTLFGFAPHAEA